MAVEAYSVNIIGLSNKIHPFEYEIGDHFFGHYGTDLVSKGSFKANVSLNKHETFIEVNFDIIGEARLVCDRSLEEFSYPIEINKKVVFKYGDEEKEISDEIIIIPREMERLELGQYMYEFIGLAIPMKKLHPRFNEEDDDSTGKIIYSSSDQEKIDDEATDPRWEALKNLKSKLK